jgi:hypothetical protein
VNAAIRDFYRNRPVMITGGLDFIGSNLARQLVAAGADVLMVDALMPGYGGNTRNIDGIEDAVGVNYADVRNDRIMDGLVREVIFNLAGQVSHIDSEIRTPTWRSIAGRSSRCSKPAGSTTWPRKSFCRNSSGVRSSRASASTSDISCVQPTSMA